MVAYMIVVTQPKALLQGAASPFPQLPSVVLLQWWLHGKQLAGTGCCFPRLNYARTLCADPRHCSPAAALPGAEAKEGKGRGEWEPGRLLQCRVKRLRETKPVCLAALVRFPDAVVPQVFPRWLKLLLFFTPSPLPWDNRLAGCV